MIAEFLEALDLRDVTLVGNDSGGALCQFVVTRRPERVGRLVLTTCDGFEIFPPKLFSYLRWFARVPGVTTVMAQLMRLLPPLRRLSIAYGVLSKDPLPQDLLGAYVRPASRDSGIRRDLKKFLAGMSPELTLAAARDLHRFPSA